MKKNKSLKAILVGTMAIIGVLLLIGGWYQYHTIKTTQAAYYAIYHDYDIAQYNDVEKMEYQALLNDKEAAFHDKNVNILKRLNEAFKLLNDKVELRIKYELKRVEIEAIHVVEHANEEEQVAFNQYKAEVLLKVERYEPMMEIDAAIVILRQMNEDIAIAVHERTDVGSVEEDFTPSSYNNGREYQDDNYEQDSSGNSAIYDPFGEGQCSALGNCSEQGESGSVNWSMNN